MSCPRQILPGTTYLLSRRCFQRQFLVRPSKLVNQILLYCLAYAANKFDIAVHAFCCMSNHYHLVVTDRSGKLPEFMRWYNEFTAKCINALYGRWESVWSPTRSYSSVETIGSDAVLGEIVYALTNPTAAGLVRYGHHWPGLRCGPPDLGKTLKVRRPHIFFRKDGRMPDMLELKLSKPGMFSEMDDDAFVTLVEREVACREDALRHDADEAGRLFIGRRAVLFTSPMQNPSTHEPRRQMNPRVACRNKQARIEALRRIKGFIDGYRQALVQYRAGHLDVIFPAGTYWLRVHLGAKCAAPG